MIQELEQKICFWYNNGSTNPTTKKNESPQYCKNCNGHNYECQNYLNNKNTTKIVKA